jgi:hypothetical protein
MANIIGQLLVELGINTAAFTGGMDKATYAAKKFGGELKGSFSQLGNSFSQLGNTLGASFGPIGGIVNALTQGIGAMSGALRTASSNVPVLLQVAGATAGIGGAAIAGAAGFAAMSIAGSELAEELIRNSEKLGVTTEQMAGLKYAAEYAGVPVQTLIRGFAHFSKSLGDIGEKTTPATVALKNFGVTAGTGTYDALIKVGAGIQKIEDPVQRMTAATTIFGTMLGLRLLPLLDDSSHGLEHFAQMAKDSGVSIDENGVKATDKWKDATVGLSSAWDGLKLSFANSDWVTLNIAGLTEAVRWATNLINKKEEASAPMGAAEAEETAGTAYGKSRQEAAAAQPAKTAAAVEAAKQLKDQTEKTAAETRRAASAAEEHFKQLQAGGAAALRLKTAEDGIKEDEEAAKEHAGKVGAKELWDKAAAVQATIPALKASAEEERRVTAEEANTAANRRKWQQEWIKFNEELDAQDKKNKEREHASAEYFKKMGEGWRKTTEEVRKYGIEAAAAQEKNDYAGQVAGFKVLERALEQKHTLGLISEKDYAAAMIKLYEDEEKADKEHIQREIDAQKAIAYGVGATGPERDKALIKIIDLQGQLNELTAEYGEKIQGVHNTLAKVNESWTTYFGRWKEETGSLSNVLLSLSKELQQNLTKSIDGVSNALAKTIVEGKNFGKQMKEVAREMAESFISSAAKMLIHFILVQVGLTVANATGNKARQMDDKKTAIESTFLSAKSAAAKGWDAGMKFPFPLDFIMAPVFAGAAFAGTMAAGAAEQGGLVGYDDMVIAAHKNEMVLPAPLSQKVQNMTDPGKQSGGHDIHVHYSPTVHTIDGKGMSQVLNEHSQVIEAHVKKAMRRQNR